MRTIVYSLEVATFIVIFYLLFKWIMSRETIHRSNRFLLLGSVLLSFILPLCSLNISVSSVENPTIAFAQSVIALEEVIIRPNRSNEAIGQMLIIASYYIGVIACIVRILVSIISAFKIFSSGERHQLSNGVMLVVVDSEQEPFSWFNYIVISKKDYECNASEILTHEQAHINYHHSFDVLLFDMLCCLQWFNPAMWLMRRELCAVHEYEADKAVLDSGINAKQYQILLIKKAAGAKWYSIANSFNHSKLKYRITMMSRKRSSVWTIAKALYVLPIVAIAVVAFANISCSNSEGEISENIGVINASSNDLTTNAALKAENGESNSAEDEVFMVVENMPKFPGGEEAMRIYLAENIKYPENAINRQVEGRVFISFVIDKEGNVTDVKPAKEIDQDLDLEAVRVVKSMPKWIPGTQRGVPVNVSFVVPVNFVLN